MVPVDDLGGPCYYMAEQGRRTTPVMSNSLIPHRTSGRRMTPGQSSPGDRLVNLLFPRLRALLAANLGELVDRSDNPDHAIRCAIREMEDTLIEVRASAARTIADRKEASRHARRLTALADDWTDKAELALSKDREDLARAALVEKARVAGLARELTAEAHDLDASLASYEGDIVKLQAKLSDARARQSAIATRMESAANAIRLRQAYDGEQTRDALARFELLERRADALEGRADSLTLGTTRTLEEDFSDLGDSAIDEELARMKAKTGETR